MLRNLLGYFNTTQTADTKSAAKEITAADFENNKRPPMRPKERDKLAAHITQFSKQLSPKYEEKIALKQRDSDLSFYDFQPIQYITMRIEHGLGLKSYNECLEENWKIANCLPSSQPNSADGLWSAIPFRFEKNMRELKFYDATAVAFMRLYKEHLDTPTHLSFLTENPYKARHIHKILDAFLETPTADKEDFTFCCQLFSDQLIFSFIYLEKYHLKTILEKLLDLKNHHLNTAPHRAFILELLKNTPKDNFQNFATLDISSAIQHVGVLPENKEQMANTGPRRA